jgi:hypothetical protein
MKTVSFDNYSHQFGSNKSLHRPMNFPCSQYMVQYAKSQEQHRFPLYETVISVFRSSAYYNGEDIITPIAKIFYYCLVNSRSVGFVIASAEM